MEILLQFSRRILHVLERVARALLEDGSSGLPRRPDNRHTAQLHYQGRIRLDEQYITGEARLDGQQFLPQTSNAEDVTENASHIYWYG